MEHDDLAIDALEEKINRLEKIMNTNHDMLNTSFIESLLAANNILTAASNKGKNIQALYSRLPELERVQSDVIVGNPTSEFDRKLNLVLSLSNQYAENVKVLDKVSSLHNSLDKGNLGSLDEVRPELAEVLEQYTQLKQQLVDADTGASLRDAWQQINIEIVKLLGAANNSLAQVENSIPAKQQKK